MTDIQDLIDRENIRDLMARNTAFMDGHGGSAEDIYAEDVSLRSPVAPLSGREAVLGRIGPNPDRPVQFQHFFTDLLITVNGDRAAVFANLLVQGFQRGQEPHNSRGLRPEYQLERRNGKWLIIEAAVTPMWEVGSINP